MIPRSSPLAGSGVVPLWPIHARPLMLGVGAAALTIYLLTLYPGLVGDGDTPKFQYVGAVGGTPHNPGYPLYLVVSWLFSRLPVSNLAWRINLLSAVAAAVAVALVALVALRLRVRPLAAVAVALMAACGPVFWSQATLAEVYTLAALLQTALIATLFAFGAARRPRSLVLAALILALALGHHPTIVVLLPALVIYVLAVDRSVMRRPRLLAALVLLPLAGLAQYLLILWRTLHAAPYLGSTAHNLRELIDVMRAAQFGNRLMGYDLATLVTERLPLCLGVVRSELGWGGLGLLVLGIARGLRLCPREGAALLGSALLTFGFALQYRVDDTDVFLIPTLFLLWPLVGLGLEALVALAPLPRWARDLVIAGLPLLQVTTHWKASDHSQRTFELRYFRQLAEDLPTGSVLLAESYTVDQMLLYELLGEGYGARRSLRLAACDAESARSYAERGLPVFAFERCRQRVSAAGLRFEPVRLIDGPLDEVLARLPAGLSVALASRESTPALARAATALGASVGGGAFALFARPERQLVEGPLPLTLTRLAAPEQSVLRLEVDGDGARLLSDARLEAHSPSGTLVAWFNPAGRRIEAHALDPHGPLTVPFSRRSFPVYRLVWLAEAPR